MCGIIGIASTSPVKNKEWLANGRDSMKHRGPDDFGSWWSDDSCVGFAHRRLSIVDLTSRGQQPMVSENMGLTIVFNGMIYNFKQIKKHLQSRGYSFVSGTDTEVILASFDMWGSNCVAKFIGMFAFVIFDHKTKKLFLARDRVGEKPLFLRVLKDRSVQFASELKGLFSNPENPRRIDNSALYSYLEMGYVKGNMCILEGYEKLPAGCFASFDLKTGEFCISKYWSVPNETVQDYKSEDQLSLELEELLEKAVCRQLEADVEVGVLLSGGMDSSLVTAIAARNQKKIKTFNISFPGQNKFDEAAHARLVANHFDTEHYELPAKSASASLIGKLAKQFDQPVADSSMIPTYLVSEMISNDCDVALGGDGGDELFGGYGHYGRLLWMQSKLKLLPSAARKLIASSSGFLLPVGFKGRNWLQSIDCDPNEELPNHAIIFDKASITQLLTDAINIDIAPCSQRTQLGHKNDIIRSATEFDFLNYLPEDLLVKIDRCSMLNSLELRSPFLDKELVEFSFNQVPSYLKVTKTAKKILLKKLASKILPDSFDFDRKQGFSIPLSNWLTNGPFRDLFLSVLLDKDCIFNRRFIVDLIRGQDKGRANGERLFSLVVFELWRREYEIEF